jgi:ATP-binding cassette subfamily B protein
MQYCVGIAMETDWGDDDSDGRIDKGLARRVFTYFRPYWRAGLLALCCIAFGAALGLVPALIFRELIDQLGAPDPSFGDALALIGIGITAAIVGGAIGVGQSYLSEHISQGIIFDLREQLFGRLLHRSVGFYTSNRAGEVMSRIGNDINGIEDVVADTVFGTVSNAIICASTLAVMFAFDWRLTLVALVLLPAFALPTRRAGRRVYRARGRVQNQLAAMTAYLQEVLGLSGSLLVKAFVREHDEQHRFRGLNDELRSREIHASMIARRFGAVMQALQTIGPALLMLAGAWLVIYEGTSVGTIFVFATVLVSRFGMAAGSLGQTHVNLIGSLALFRRIFSWIDAPPEIADAPAARSLERVDGAVTLEHVTFAYPGQRRPALDDVSVEIAPGQLVALVGPSGAGKTTITTLIPRFYDTDAGSVRVDGTDVRELTIESLRSNIGIVFQDTFLFHASIRDNLLYAAADATQPQIEHAAHAAHLHEFIASLPDGYDTVVGERGHRLSGGEKQRLAIARVILKDPRILLLDEATSNLDTVSEQLIQAALAPLFAGRTSIVIAHRLSTILAADLILVMNRGQLVERGTHHELLEHAGLYATLYEQQFRAGAEPALT